MLSALSSLSYDIWVLREDRWDENVDWKWDYAVGGLYDSSAETRLRDPQ